MSTLALAALALSAPAHALDCAASSMGASLPADGAVDVPVNARPAVAIYGDATRVTLSLEVDGVDVEDAVFVQISDGDPQIWQLDGSDALASNAAVVVRAMDEGWDDTPYLLGEAAFETGSHSDTAPPAALDSVGVSYEFQEDDWGPEHRYTIDAAGGADPSGTAYIIELAPNGDFDAASVRTRLDQPSLITHGLCTFDDAATLDPATTWVRVTPIDAAGNRGEAVVVEPDATDDMVCGTRCSVVPVGTFSLFGALMGLVGISRRRH